MRESDARAPREKPRARARARARRERSRRPEPAACRARARVPLALSRARSGRYILRTENAVSAGGALCECYKQGMLEARFTDKNKLGRLELVFDVMSFVQQLTRASGLAEFPTVPHSVEAALLKESAEARVITAAAPPHGIEFVNAAWSDLCGYSLDEVRGLTLRVIQGPLTEAEAKAHIGAAARARRAACATLTNYAKGDVAFRNFLRIYPLWHDGTVTHLLGVLEACTGSSTASSSDGLSGRACAARATARRATLGCAPRSTARRRPRFVAARRARAAVRREPAARPAAAVARRHARAAAARAGRRDPAIPKGVDLSGAMRAAAPSRARRAARDRPDPRTRAPRGLPAPRSPSLRP